MSQPIPVAMSAMMAIASRASKGTGTFGAYLSRRSSRWYSEPFLLGLGLTPRPLPLRDALLVVSRGERDTQRQTRHFGRRFVP